MLYKNAKAKWFFLDGEFGIQPCEVRFDGKKIVAAFHETSDYNHTIWTGNEQGKGHYKLNVNEGYGQASLHHFDGGGYLDGYWEEEESDGTRAEGMIRIELGAAEKKR